MAIATHLITGFLGAGKTTTLQFLLRSLKERGEKTAVLVNEFGALGIDGTLLSGSQHVAVKELPDGCICCTLAGRLLEALQEIAQRVQPARLFVEPTGLARPNELKRIFQDEEMARQYALGPVLTLVDPRTYLKLLGRNLPFYEDQIREADVVIANKLDQVSPEELSKFRADLPRLNSRARLVETQFGQVPLDALEGTETAIRNPQSSPAHAHAHGTNQGVGFGFSRNAEVLFSAARLRAFFEDMNAGKFGEKPWRAKGIFRCQDGWRLYQLSGSGVDETAGAPSPGDNRCEVIAQQLEPSLQNRLTEALEGCVLLPRSPHAA